jgi:hypothetical protein
VPRLCRPAPVFVREGPAPQAHHDRQLAAASPNASAFSVRGDRFFGRASVQLAVRKRCYYSFAGNEYTRALQSYEVWPVSVQRTGG